MTRLGWNRFTLIAVAVGTLALVGGGYALAASTTSATVTPVMATFQGTLTAQPQVTPCRSSTTAYRFSATYAGTISSASLAQLNGNFTLTVSGISDTSSGALYSSQTGTLRVTNPTSGALQAAGNLQAIQENADGYGFINGRTYPITDQGGNQIAGNFTSTIGQGTISGELGGTDSTSQPGNEPAVLVSGTC